MTSPTHHIRTRLDRIRADLSDVEEAAKHIDRERYQIMDLTREAGVIDGDVVGRVEALCREVVSLRADLADHRTAIAHASAKRDAFREEAADLRRQLGEARSANGVEHLGLHRDLARMCAELDALRAARMDPDPAEAADVHLHNAIAAAHDGNLNLASSEATKALACLGLDSAFVATVSRAEKAPPPEPAESRRVAWVTCPGDSGPGLHIDGRERGNIVLCDDGTWLVSALGAPQVLAIPDEPTARAVLLALVGEDPRVTVALSLRDSWTYDDWSKARESGLGSYVAELLGDDMHGLVGRQYTEDPDVIRQWVAGGQGLMTLRVVEESSDDCPF